MNWRNAGRLISAVTPELDGGLGKRLWILTGHRET